jgi:hypothetical protein
MKKSKKQISSVYSSIRFASTSILIIFLLFSILEQSFAQNSGNLAAVSSQDGRIEVFLRNPDNRWIYHTWQTPTGWQPWEITSSSEFEGGFAAALDVSGRLLFAYIDYTGGIIGYRTTNAAGASLNPEQHIAGTHDLRTLTIATNADGRLELIMLDKKGSVWTIPQAEAGKWTWGTTHSLGGHDLKFITATPYKDGRLAIVALGNDNVIYWKSQTGPNRDWGAWESLGGINIQSIAAFRNADGRLEVHALGKDKNLWERFQTKTGGWSNWAVLLKGPFQKPISLVKNEDGRLELFAIYDGKVVHSWQRELNAAWTGNLEQFSVSQVISHVEPLHNDGRLALLTLADHNKVFYIHQLTKNGSWISNWETLPDLSPAASSGGNSNSGNTQPTRTTGALIPTFLFGDVVGTVVVPVTVTFIGTLLTSKGTTGLDHFTVTASRNLSPGTIRQGVSAQIDNLRPGTWRIIAQPSAISGPTQCTYEIGLATQFMTIYPERQLGKQCQ